MVRILELFMVANAVAGIATFLGIRFAWRRSRDKAKRGFDIIHMDRAEEDEPQELPPPKRVWRIGQYSENRPR